MRIAILSVLKWQQKVNYKIICLLKKKKIPWNSGTVSCEFVMAALGLVLFSLSDVGFLFSAVKLKRFIKCFIEQQKILCAFVYNQHNIQVAYHIHALIFSDLICYHVQKREKNRNLISSECTQFICSRAITTKRYLKAEQKG